MNILHRDIKCEATRDEGKETKKQQQFITISLSLSCVDVETLKQIL